LSAVVFLFGVKRGVRSLAVFVLFIPLPFRRALEFSSLVLFCRAQKLPVGDGFSFFIWGVVVLFDAPDFGCVGYWVVSSERGILTRLICSHFLNPCTLKSRKSFITENARERLLD